MFSCHIHVRGSSTTPIPYHVLKSIPYHVVDAPSSRHAVDAPLVMSGSTKSSTIDDRQFTVVAMRRLRRVRVDGPSRATSPSSCVARLCLQERGEVAVIVRRAFVDDSPSSRCIGGLSRAASSRRTHRKLEAAVLVPSPPRCRRLMDGGSRSGRGGRRGNWDRPCLQRQGRGRWRKGSPPTTPCLALEDWERTRNEEWKEDEMEEEKRRHEEGG